MYSWIKDWKRIAFVDEKEEKADQMMMLKIAEHLIEKKMFPSWWGSESQYKFALGTCSIKTQQRTIKKFAVKWLLKRALLGLFVAVLEFWGCFWSSSRKKSGKIGSIFASIKICKTDNIVP